MADWDPDLYERFRDERAVPFYDLMGLLRPPEPGLRIVDLGCGTGELTAVLAGVYEECEVLGIDNSPAMMAKASQLAKGHLQFELADISLLQGKWDLILANASLQWVDDHPALLKHLLSCLKPDGQLAVQVPTNQGHPSQTLMADIAREEPYRSALGGWEKTWSVLDMHGYGETLHRLEAVDLVLFEKLYPHVLPDATSMVLFTESTAMRPYLERLPVELQVEFKAELTRRLTVQYPESPVFFGFKRLFFTARQP